MTGHLPKLTRKRLLTGAFAAALAVAAVTLSPFGSTFAQGPGYGPGSGPMSGPGRGPMWGGRDMWLPGWMHRRMWRRGPGDHPWRGNMNARMQRHWTYMHDGLPKEYVGARSTIKPTAANIEEGGKLYMTHCASCHGKTGLGDGDAGKSLSPSPALLAYMIQRPVSVDEFLLWSISEGGKQFKTDMPAFKDVLKKDEIWKIVAWMREGFPPVKEENPKSGKK